ncbi:MAG TPA: hypothetical protein VMS08_04790, partial [Candidatus Saccharimonadia bacterium]|nr:hypothetical protein [Candidatus Saccharimonadia bacterium]
ERNLQALIQKITPLLYVLEKLDEADIRYGLYAGSHVAVLVNNRVPTDVDFLVHDDDLPRLKSAFPFAKTKDVGDGVFLYVGDNDVIEFMGAADVIKGEEVYPFRLTDLAVSKLTTYDIEDVKINLVDPVDTLLLKAILKQGADKGKHDLEDIEAVLQITELDAGYLSKRLKESGAMNITKGVWDKFGVKP